MAESVGRCIPASKAWTEVPHSGRVRPRLFKDAPEVLRPTHRRDEFRPAIPQRVARQQSPPPLHRHAHPKSVPGSATMNLQRTVNSVLTVCLSPGDHPIWIFDKLLSEIGLRLRKCRLEIRDCFSLPAVKTALDLHNENVATPSVLYCLLGAPEPLLGRLHFLQEGQIVVPSDFCKWCLRN